MPAYNAAKTLQRTYDEVMEQGIVDLGKEGAIPPFVPSITARLWFKAAVDQSGSPGQVGDEIIRCDGLPRLDFDGGK